MFKLEKDYHGLAVLGNILLIVLVGRPRRGFPLLIMQNRFSLSRGTKFAGFFFSFRS